jgi:hypothetical protein
VRAQLFNGGPCDRLAPYALHNLQAARHATPVPTLTPDDERPFADEPAAAGPAAATDASGEAQPTAAQAGNVAESGEAAMPAQSAVLYSDLLGLGELARLLEAGLTTPSALGCVRPKPPPLARVLKSGRVVKGVATPRIRSLGPQCVRRTMTALFWTASLHTLGTRHRCTDGAPPHVHVFEGHARWSRVQLQNEIARGDWGVVTARAHEALPLPLQLPAAAAAGGSDDDVDATAAPPAVLAPAQLWQHIIDAGRAIFANSPL